MRVAFLGLGLIGGSIARAIRSRPAGAAALEDPDGRWSVVAWSPGGRGPALAVDAGVVDRAAATVEEALDGADLVVLAAPADACLTLLDELAGLSAPALAPDAVITDVASTKGAIVDRAVELGLRFVGGHPMAGRDTSGFTAAESQLFSGRPWVIVPSADDAAVALVERLARATGARPVRMTAAGHDDAVAAISHLPLVLSAALVETVAGGPDEARADWPAAAALAAGGWRDMSRLARGDVAMGAGIVTTNAAAIDRRLRALIAALEAWMTELERPGGPDGAWVTERLRVARDRLEADDR